jgi:hypothetical protein
MEEWSYSSLIFILELDEDEWSASHPAHFTPRGKILVPTGWEAGWTSKLVWTLEKRKISCPCQESNPGHPTLSLLLY